MVLEHARAVPCQRAVGIDVTATWDETFMAAADAMARRSACVRQQNGAVIVDRNNRIVATGYNGWPAPMGSPPCDQNAQHNALFCARARSGPADPHSYLDCYSVHAEANSLLFCDRTPRVNGTIYVSSNLCWECAKLVGNSGLARVVMRMDKHYRPVVNVLKLMRDCDIVVTPWEM